MAKKLSTSNSEENNQGGDNMAKKVPTSNNGNYKKGGNNMKQLRLIQDLNTLLSSFEETGTDIEVCEDGVVAIPPSGAANWIPLFIKEDGANLEISIAEDDKKSLLKRIVEEDADADSESQLSGWYVSKDQFEEIQAADAEAIFDIAAIIEQFELQQQQVDSLMKLVRVLGDQELHGLSRLLQLLMVAKPTDFFKQLDAIEDSKEKALEFFKKKIEF